MEQSSLAFNVRARSGVSGIASAPMTRLMAESALEQSISQNAAKPAEVSGDAGSFKQHSLKDQIEADRYLESKKAARSNKFPIRIARSRPPGAHEQ